jgi:hypothetical protein
VLFLRFLLSSSFVIMAFLFRSSSVDESAKMDAATAHQIRTPEEAGMSCAQEE